MNRRGFTLLELLAAIGVASIALVMLAMSALVFTGVYAIGNPIDVLISPDATQDIRAQASRHLGLDRPVPRATLGDALSFGFWSSVALAQTAAMFALLALPVAGLGLLVRALV